MIEQQWSALFLQAYLQTKSENVQPDDLALTQGQSSHQLLEHKEEDISE